MRLTHLVYTALAVAMVTALPAAADLNFSDGRWRLEMNGGGAIDSGSQDRGGDVLLHFDVEYEIPTTKHLALGLRLMPALVYFQEGDNDDGYDFWNLDEYRDDDGDGDTVFGAGLGLALRVYAKPDTYSGLFFEATGGAFGHGGEFNGNSSNFNFITGAGVGYQFNNAWHAVLKFEHISNAGIGSENQGVNAIGFGLGYRF